MKTLKIELGALAECPVYCNHERGKNWLATIAKDPTSPGGLKRDFWPRAKGQYYYMIPSAARAGDIIEIAGDYYTRGGSKHAHRLYGIIREISPDTMTIEEYESPTAAFAAAAAPAPATVDLEVERARLLARLAEIEMELAKLQPQQ